MTRLKDKKTILVIILAIVIIICIVIGLTRNNNNKVKKIKKDESHVINDDIDFEIDDTIQYNFRRLRFNLPKEFKEKKVDSNVVKYTISTKEEKATLTVAAELYDKTPKNFLIDEFGFKKSDGFKNKEINKVVWLKVKKNNIYGYAIRQRGYVFALRYSYTKSKKIAKNVPKILEDTLYFKVYYNDEETKK